MSFGPIARAAAIMALALLLALPGAAQDPGEDGCVLNRQVYPEGYEICQSGTQKRCESGAWADTGLCDGDTTPPPPRSEGGDEDIDPSREGWDEGR